MRRHGLGRVLRPVFIFYNVVFPSALTFAHLALAAAAIFALPAALIFRFFRPLVFAGSAALPRYLAHLFLAASDIAFRPAALILFLLVVAMGLPGLPALPGGLPRLGAGPSPPIESSSDSRSSIWDLRSMIFWSWAEDRSFKFVMGNY